MLKIELYYLCEKILLSGKSQVPSRAAQQILGVDVVEAEVLCQLLNGFSVQLHPLILSYLLLQF